MELPSSRPTDKKPKKENEEKSQSAVMEDPLSAGGDPLSGSLASDPLTAALTDPLASGPSISTGGIFETPKVTHSFDITNVNWCSRVVEVRCSHQIRI